MALPRMFYATNNSIRHVVSMWHSGFRWNARGNCRRGYTRTGVSEISRVPAICMSVCSVSYVAFDIAFLTARSFARQIDPIALGKEDR